MEVNNRHPQLVKKVELLVELGRTCLPDAAEAQQVIDRREEHREDLLPVMSKDFEHRRELLHDQELQDLHLIGIQGPETHLGKGGLVVPNISPSNKQLVKNC